MSTPGQIAVETPDKAAAIMLETGEEVSFRQLEERSCQLAHYWHEAGLRPGDHVSIWAENLLEFYVVYWAAMRSGLCLTTINRYLSADEGAYILSDSDAKGVVGSEAYRSVIAEALAATPACDVRLIVGEGDETFTSFEQALADQPTTALEEEPMGNIMLYSSGTTGRPKGIKQPPAQAAFGEVPNPIAGVAMMFGLSAETRYLSPAPLYHSAPLAWTVGIQSLGGTILVMERFDPAEFLRAIDEHAITMTQVVPTMFVRMLKLDEAERQRHDVSSLEFVVHAAAPCPVPVKQQMFDWWGPIIHEYYAGTEGNGMTWATPDQWLSHPGTVGQALVGTLKICDDEGNALAPGEVGTVYFVSQGRQFEYHGDPDKTAAARHPSHAGASTLGDIGYVDDEGFLFLTDRKAFMIISGGVNIYPQEIEDALIVHPAVADVAVFGLPDDDMGEYVHAVVQPAPGVDASPELAQQLRTFARESIAGYKVPRVVDFRDELPRLPTGKLYKGQLRDEYLAALAND